MAFAHTTKLLLGSTGLECEVFDEYRVALDVTQVANPFTFTLWRSAAGQSAWDVLTQSRRRVRAGDWIGLEIDSAAQLVGQVDHLELVHDRQKGASLVISGRDLAGPAVDADADPAVLIGDDAVLQDAITALLGGLGVPLSVGVDAAAARAAASRLRTGSRGLTPVRRRQRVGRTHPHPGQRVWGLVETLCRKVGLMAWVAPVAERTLAVVLDVPDYAQPPVYQLTNREGADVAHAEVDGQVLGASHRVVTRGVPTVVTAVARSGYGDKQHARYRSAVANGGLFSDALTAGLVSDQLPELPRWIVSEKARSQDAATQDASRVIADHNRDLRKYECTVQGHGQWSGGRLRLYAIDTTARVRDDVLGVDEVMYLERVEFAGAREGGTTTKLTLHPLGAIQLVPDPDASA